MKVRSSFKNSGTNNSKAKTNSLLDKDDISFNYSEIEDESKIKHTISMTKGINLYYLH